MSRAARKAQLAFKKVRKWGWLSATQMQDTTRTRDMIRFGPSDPAVVRKQQQTIRNRKMKVTLPKMEQQT